MGAVKNSFVKFVVVTRKPKQSGSKIRWLISQLDEQKKMIDKENCHILIIREKMNALLSERILKDSGYTNIFTASSSKYALSIIEKTTPDLIFLDYRLAEDEPTEIELYNQLKRFPALENTAFLIYVAWLPQDLYEEIKGLGFSGIILMPMSPDELIQACEALLSGGTYFRDFDEYW